MTILIEFDLQCRAFDIIRPIPEYRFHPVRRWRIDWAWPAQKLAVEIEGGIYSRGRHVRGAGFQKDMEKYNALTLAGWRLLRFTPAQVKDGTAARIVQEYFKVKVLK